MDNSTEQPDAGTMQPVDHQDVLSKLREMPAVHVLSQISPSPLAPVIGGGLISQKLNELKDKYVAPTLAPVAKKAGDIAGSFGKVVGQNQASQINMSEPQYKPQLPEQLSRGGNYVARSFLNGMIGEHAYSGMDPTERKEAEDALQRHVGGKVGAGVFRFGAGAVPMFLLGPGGEGAAEGTAINALKTGAMFGSADSLLNQGTDIGTEAAKGAVGQVALHGVFKAGGKVLGWVSSRFRNALEKDVAALDPTGNKTLQDIFEEAEAKLSPKAEEELRSKAKLMFGAKSAEEISSEAAQLSSRVKPGELGAHADTVSAIPEGPGRTPLSERPPEGPQTEAVATAVKKGLLEPHPRSKLFAKDLEGTAVARPRDLGGPSVASVSPDGKLVFEPVSPAEPKSWHQPIEPGDAIQLPNGERGELVKIMTKGDALVRRPNGTNAITSPANIAHTDDGNMWNERNTPEDKLPLTVQNLDAFRNARPNPTIDDLKAHFGLSDTEAASIRNVLRLAGGPPSAGGKPPMLPPPAPSEPAGPPPEPPQLPPGTPAPSFVDKQLSMLRNAGRIAWESIGRMFRGAGFNTNVPDVVNGHALRIKAAQNMIQGAADHIDAMKAAVPELVNNHQLNNALGSWLEGNMSTADIAKKFPEEFPKFQGVITDLKDQIANRHQLLGYDTSEKYAAMLYLRRLAPDVWRKMVPLPRINRAIDAMKRDWKLDDEQAWEAVHHLLGTDDAYQAVGSIRSLGAAANRLKSPKDLPREVRELLGPAGGIIRAAHSAASQDVLLHLKNAFDAVAQDPAVFSKERQPGFVSVPNNVRALKISDSIRDGFWHRDLNDLFGSAQSMSKQVGEYSMFMNKLMGLARWRKANLAFGPLTFLKHIEMMRDANMMAGGIVPWRPKQAGSDIMEAMKALGSYRDNPTVMNLDAEAVHAAKRDGAMGRNFASYESNSGAIKSAIQNFESYMFGKKEPTYMTLLNAAHNTFIKNGGLAGKAAEMFYQRLQNVTQLANYIALRRKFIPEFGGDMNAAGKKAGQIVAMSFPDASNVGRLTEAIRRNPVLANGLAFATPVMETLRRYSMIPYRIKNGETDLAGRLALHHLINLGLYGTAGYGLYRGGGFMSNGALGWVRHLNGIGDDAVHDAIMGRTKADRSAAAPLVTAIPDENGKPFTVDHAAGAYMLEALRGVANEHSWIGKAIKVGTNFISEVSGATGEHTAASLGALGLLDEEGNFQGKMRPGHAASAIAHAAVGSGMAPFSQMAGHVLSEKEALSPKSWKDQPPTTSRAIMQGIFGRGLFMNAPNKTKAMLEDAGESRRILNEKIGQISSDRTLSLPEKQELIRDLYRKGERVPDIWDRMQQRSTK